jgi:hypothetical protein
VNQVPDKIRHRLLEKNPLSRCSGGPVSRTEKLEAGEIRTGDVFKGYQNVIACQEAIFQKRVQLRRTRNRKVTR